MDNEPEITEDNIKNIYDSITKENEEKNDEINSIDTYILDLDISIDKCQLEIETFITQLNGLNINTAKTNFEKEQYCDETEKINKNIKITTTLINDNTDIVIKKKQELLDYKKNYSIFIVEYFYKLSHIGKFLIDPIIKKAFLDELDINIIDCVNYNLKQVIDFILTNKKSITSNDLLEELTCIIKNQCDEKNVLLLDKIKYSITSNNRNEINIYKNMNIENSIYSLIILILYYYYTIPSNIIVLSLILYYYQKKRKNIVLCNEIDILKINKNINKLLDNCLVNYYYHLYSFCGCYIIYYFLMHWVIYLF